MRPNAILAILMACILAAPAGAQQPYGGMQARGIKAFSAEQLADLRAGRGMGLALPAELNGWPGPLHALELAEPLGLAPAQRAEVEALFVAMRGESISAGEAVIDAERALDALFAHGTPTPEAIAAATARAAAAQGALRAVHLRFHLTTTALLTPAQREQYAVLRGYRDHSPATPSGHQRRHGH